MKPHKLILPQPGDISDEAAAVLTEFLFHLADVCNLRYRTKIWRHDDAKRAAEIDKWDPDRPWCRRSPPA